MRGRAEKVRLFTYQTYCARSDLDNFKLKFDFSVAAYMTEKFCVNTEKWKMCASKTCLIKTFYHGKKFQFYF